MNAGRVPTGPDAKTSCLVPEMKRFYAAIPQASVILVPPIHSRKKAQIVDAQIFVYDVVQYSRAFTASGLIGRTPHPNGLLTLSVPALTARSNEIRRLREGLSDHPRSLA